MNDFYRLVTEQDRSDFLSRVSIGGWNTCWRWNGLKRSDGYGLFLPRGKKLTIRAHRASHEIFIGPIPDSLIVCHSCDCRPCVNPRHLFIGTRTDNARDMRQKGRGNRWERNGMAKLTRKKASDIRQRYSEGETQDSLADRFGVTQATIWSLLANRTWVTP